MSTMKDLGDGIQALNQFDCRDASCLSDAIKRVVSSYEAHNQSVEQKRDLDTDSLIDAANEYCQCI